MVDEEFWRAEADRLNGLERKRIAGFGKVAVLLVATDARPGAIVENAVERPDVVAEAAEQHLGQQRESVPHLFVLLRLVPPERVRFTLEGGAIGSIGCVRRVGGTRLGGRMPREQRGGEECGNRNGPVHE